MEKFYLGETKIAVAASDISFYELQEEEINDIIVIPHALPDIPVDLFREISGEHDRLRRIVSLSEKYGNTVIAGVTLDYGGIKKLSAVIAHKGELIDVADSCSVSDPYTRAGTVKIYNTGKIKAAVLTGGDARVRFILGKISGLCSMVISLEPEYRPENEQRIRKLSAEFALPILYVSPARIFFCGEEGYGNSLN